MHSKRTHVKDTHYHLNSEQKTPNDATKKKKASPVDEVRDSSALTTLRAVEKVSSYDHTDGDYELSC